MTHTMFNKLAPTILESLLSEYKQISQDDYAAKAQSVVHESGGPQKLFDLGYTAYINAKYAPGAVTKMASESTSVIDAIMNMLILKCNHYNGADEDRFASFKRAAQLANVPPQRALMMMVLKHLASTVKQMSPPEPIDAPALPSAPSLDAAIDIMAYAVLLAAMRIEKSGAFG